MAWTRKGGYSGQKADMWSVVRLVPFLVFLSPSTSTDDAGTCTGYVQGILLALLLTGAHPFEPWSSSHTSHSSSISSASSSQSQHDAAAQKLLKRFGCTAAHEIEMNPTDRAVCEGVVKAEVVLPGVVFGSANEAGACFLSFLSPARSPSPKILTNHSLSSPFASLAPALARPFHPRDRFAGSLVALDQGEQGGVAEAVREARR